MRGCGTSSRGRWANSSAAPVNHATTYGNPSTCCRTSSSLRAMVAKSARGIRPVATSINVDVNVAVCFATLSSCPSSRRMKSADISRWMDSVLPGNEIDRANARAPTTTSATNEVNDPYDVTT